MRARAVPRAYNMQRGDSLELPDWLQEAGGIRKDDAEEEQEASKEPLKPGALQGALRKAKFGVKVGMALNVDSRKTSGKKGVTMNTEQNSVTIVPSNRAEDWISARLVLKSSLHATYVDETERYKNLLIPANALLTLEGHNEILIPDGEITVQLLEYKTKRVLNVYFLSYGPLAPKRIEPIKSRDGSISVAISPIDEGNFTIDGITLKLPKAVLAHKAFAGAASGANSDGILSSGHIRMDGIGGEGVEAGLKSAAKESRGGSDGASFSRGARGSVSRSGSIAPNRQGSPRSGSVSRHGSVSGPRGSLSFGSAARGARLSVQMGEGGCTLLDYNGCIALGVSALRRNALEDLSTIR